MHGGHIGFSKRSDFCNVIFHSDVVVPVLVHLSAILYGQCGVYGIIIVIHGENRLAINEVVGRRVVRLG